MQAFETEGLIGTGAAPRRAGLSLPSHRGPPRRPADAAHHRRRLARARRRGFRRAAARMAEDAAQEERLRHLRHPVARRHRGQRHRARHHRELPDPALPAERARDRAADRRDLPALRPQRPPDRDPRPRDAQARLLLPVAARQSPVRARTGSEVALAFSAASSKTDQAAIDRVLAEHGRDGFAAAWLADRGLLGPPISFPT